ncbi:MAG: class I SAM-dependent RNA methyltransferase [Paracoccaceae bacterium]
METPLTLFLTAPPGLEPQLAGEARALGLGDPTPEPGGVSATGTWPDVWRANLELRGAGRVLVRLWAFRAPHLAQLDKRARRLPWGDVLRPEIAVRVEASCRRSRIYHAGAAGQRIATAIAETLGAPVATEAPVSVLARIEDDLCTLSVDTSGALLHKRGHKQAVGKAPLRETLAALFLRAAGFSGDEPVIDPMCGSGTIPIEAAEIAAGLQPGRDRAFAFEALATHDRAAVAELRTGARRRSPEAGIAGFDRDAGAVAMARANAMRAGVADLVAIAQQPVSALAPPPDGPGLVLVNPPYGGRIGDKGRLHALYAALGGRLKAEFGGWRVGLVTGEPGLARATGLSFAETSPPIPHGPLKIRLYRTGPL